MQKPEETMLKELFQQLKQDDEHRAPLFAASWAAAHTRLATGKQTAPLQVWIRLGWLAAGLLIMSGLIVYRTKPTEVGKDVMTAKPSSSPSFVEREESVAQVTVAAARYREARVSPSRRKHLLRPRAPIVPEIVVAEAQDSEDATEFIPLRYGDDHLPMESGEVVRVQMPRSALVALGLPMDVERADTPVKADLLIGEDGQARAIRFVR